jgi:hypothetical protein
MHKLASNLMAPSFQQVRARGEMREDITDELAVTWLRSVYVVLFLREERSNTEGEALIRDYLVPSLLNPDIDNGGC